MPTPEKKTCEKNKNKICILFNFSNIRWRLCPLPCPPLLLLPWPATRIVLVIYEFVKCALWAGSHWTTPPSPSYQLLLCPILPILATLHAPLSLPAGGEGHDPHMPNNLYTLSSFALLLLLLFLQLLLLLPPRIAIVTIKVNGFIQWASNPNFTSNRIESKLFSMIFMWIPQRGMRRWWERSIIIWYVGRVIGYFCWVSQCWKSADQANDRMLFLLKKWWFLTGFRVLAGWLKVSILENILNRYNCRRF